MRTLLVCLAIFLALAVLHCDGKKKRKEGICDYEGRRIKDGQTKNLREPCQRVTCSSGSVNVTQCPSDEEDLKKLIEEDKEQRKERREQRKEEENEDDEEESNEEKIEKKQKKGEGKPFPRCCRGA
uniref:Putative secreted protein n=1 Tax=Amblyomma cajennense TaxID=34607 RepID=A0A023FFZ7_AMBCJ